MTDEITDESIRACLKLAEGGSFAEDMDRLVEISEAAARARETDQPGGAGYAVAGQIASVQAERRIERAGILDAAEIVAGTEAFPGHVRVQAAFIVTNLEAGVPTGQVAKEIEWANNEFGPIKQNDCLPK